MSPSVELPEMHEYSTAASIWPLFFALRHFPPSTNSRVENLMGSLHRKPAFPLMFFLVAVLTLLSSFAYCDDNKPSVYEVLAQYGFPIGILPKGVTGYELNTVTGHFSAYMNGTCSFSVENSYQLEYKSTISGVLSKDRIKSLKGVSVKVLFFWLSIVEVAHVGDELQFSVGIASANFPVNNFIERPQCGCGMDCNNLSTVLPSHSVST